MDKVVILARVSTDRQEYRRQINELNLAEHCSYGIDVQWLTHGRTVYGR